MKIRLIIPLPWYSKQAYDVCLDELRGGWRVLVWRLEIHSEKPFGNMSAGLKVLCQIGISTRFRPVDYTREERLDGLR